MRDSTIQKRRAREADDPRLEENNRQQRSTIIIVRVEFSTSSIQVALSPPNKVKVERRKVRCSELWLK
jgi:hypothetical protein